MILVIQFRQDITEQHEQECITSRMAESGEIRFVSIFDETIDFANPAALLRGFDRLILGGSAGLSMGAGHIENDYDKVGFILTTIEPLVRYVLDEDFPTLGTCFGHQIIAHFSGAQIAYDTNQSETGAYDLSLSPEGLKDPLFEGVPPIFTAIEGHQDSVTTKPQQAMVLAASERNQFQALRYGNHVYTTQFHCELNEQDLMYRLRLFPAYAAHASAESMDFPACPYGVRMLQNFLDTKQLSSV